MKKHNLGMLFIFLSALCFSINGLLVKFFSWSAMSINAVGNLLGALTIVLFMIIIKHKFVFNTKVLIGSAFVFFTNLLCTYANKLTTAANAVVLQFTMPIFIIAAMWLFYKEKPKKYDLITTVIVLGGIAFFVIDGLAVGNMFGNFIGLLSGIACAGVYMLEKIPGNDSLSAIVLGKFMCFVVGIPALFGEAPLGGVSIVMMIIYGIVQCGLGYVFLPLGLKYASPVSASLLSSAEPILAPVWVMIFYPKEKITLTALIGIIIVLVTLIIYNLFQARAEAAASFNEKDVQIQ